MSYLLPRQLALEVLVNIHDRILCRLGLSQVFQAYAVDQFQVAKKKMPQRLPVAVFAEQLQQIAVGQRIVLQKVVTKG